jgi:hypothetical protein
MNVRITHTLYFTCSPLLFIQTRIASGCSETEAFELTAFHSKYISPMGNFHLHLTPSYSNIRKWEGGSYKYFNKPYVFISIIEHCGKIRIGMAD